MSKNISGFTIVELLIVIVVIAILAAITIVSYNGIQARAYNSSVAAQVNALERAFRAYKAANGSFPPFGSGCIGTASDFPAVTGFAANECVSGGYGTLNTTLTNQLSTYARISSGSLKPVAYDATTVYRGVYVVSQNPTANDVYFEYMLPGDTTCPKGTKRIENANTFCYFTIT